MRLMLQAIALVVGGALLGLGGNGLTPKPAPLGGPVWPKADASPGSCRVPLDANPVRRISVEEATPLCTACSALFVDARSGAEYAAGHVKGALHLPPGEGPEPVLWRLGVYKTVVVYDGDTDCASADQVARTLLERGAPDVRVLTGAWPAWAAAGAPGDKGVCKSCGDHPPEKKSP